MKIEKINQYDHDGKRFGFFRYYSIDEKLKHECFLNSGIIEGEYIVYEY